MSRDERKKFGSFMMALQTLMREHEVLIFPSMYGEIQVWDFNPIDEERSLEQFEDRTGMH